MTFPSSFPLAFGEDVVTETGVLDHSATAGARLAEFIKTQPNFLALLAAPLTQVQDLETAFQQLNHLRALPSASGGQLDVVGQILTQPRNGLDDATYKKFLLARVRLNRSSGTINQILEIFTLITTGGVSLTEWAPAAFDLLLTGPITSAAAVTYLTILRQARAAGVGGALHWTEWPVADTFTLDGTPAQSLDAGHLTGWTP